MKRTLFSSARRIGWLLLIAGIVGFVASFVLTIEKMHLLQDPTASIPCDLNPVVSCGSVMRTEQASVFGFANSLIGVATFAALAALGVALVAGAQFRAWLWRCLVGGMILGLAGVHWLIYQSIYQIGSLCPYCMVVWVVVIVSAWYVLLFTLKEKYLRLPARLSGLVVFIQRHHADILLAWFAIIILLILQHFWYYFGKILQ